MENHWVFLQRRCKGGVREKVEARGGSYSMVWVKWLWLISMGECNEGPHSQTKRIGSIFFYIYAYL